MENFNCKCLRAVFFFEAKIISFRKTFKESEMMNKERIESMEDFEKLPEGEWVEVEGGDLEIELVEEVDA